MGWGYWSAPKFCARHHTTPKSPDDLASEPEEGTNGGAQGAVGDRSAAIRWANARGARYPKLLCRRSSLYSALHAAIFRRAKPGRQLLRRHYHDYDHAS